MPCSSERFNESMIVKYFFINHISQLFRHTVFIRTLKRSTLINFHSIAIVYTFIVNHGHCLFSSLKYAKCNVPIICQMILEKGKKIKTEGQANDELWVNRIARFQLIYSMR